MPSDQDTKMTVAAGAEQQPQPWEELVKAGQKLQDWIESPGDTNRIIEQAAVPLDGLEKQG
jgi:hypothetical protein